MQLTLVRHGEAARPLNYPDSKRPLTDRGHIQAKQTAEYLQQKVQPDVLVVSTLLRAQETLAHLQHYFPNVPVMVCDKIKPDDDAKLAIEWLAQLPFENIVVVCHMNVVAHIAELLTNQAFHSFALAEARIYDQSIIANGLSTQLAAFIPTA